MGRGAARAVSFGRFPRLKEEEMTVVIPLRKALFPLDWIGERREPFDKLRTGSRFLWGRRGSLRGSK